jgi:hypothetical protein
MAFFSDPFEAGALAILNSRYTLPEVCSYSQNFVDLIGMHCHYEIHSTEFSFFHAAFLLNQDPEKRPDIGEVQQRVAQMRGVTYQVCDVLFSLCLLMYVQRNKNLLHCQQLLISLVWENQLHILL